MRKKIAHTRVTQTNNKPNNVSNAKIDQLNYNDYHATANAGEKQQQTATCQQEIFEIVCPGVPDDLLLATFLPLETLFPPALAGTEAVDATAVGGGLWVCLGRARGSLVPGAAGMAGSRAAALVPLLPSRPRFLMYGSSNGLQDYYGTLQCHIIGDKIALM